MTLNHLRTRTQYALLLAGLLAFPLDTSASRAQKAQARTAYDRAARLRTTLESQPEDSRQKADYEKVIAAFRSVYRADPAYSKAPLAVEAEAELYEEMGRRLSAPRAFHNSVTAYEFLVQQYPHSSVSRQALLALGEIYRTDLNEPAQAQKALRKYLELYPKSEKAGEAREALKEIQSASSTRATGKTARKETASAPKVEETEPQPGRPGETLEVTSIRRWVGPNYTRIVIGVNGEVGFDAIRLSSPDRLVFDLTNARPSPELMGKTFPVEDGFLHQIRVALFKPTVTRIVLDVQRIEDYSVFPLPNPFRLIVDIHGPATELTKNESVGRRTHAEGSASNTTGTGGKEKPSSVTAATSTEPTRKSGSDREAASDETASAEPAGAGASGKSSSGTRMLAGNPGPAAKTAAPTESGSRTLTRALGLKIGRIVIDPGHGGHDTGTIGPSGFTEKDLVLDVGLRLAKLLELQAGSEVVMTRDDDTFIPLEERTAIANEKAADLFISIHANASRDPQARGLETYYLNFTSNADALEVAARENATSQESVHQLRDLIKQIALTEKIEESREFATQVEHEMHDRLAKAGAKQKDRGVKKAPFVVLIGANMPSVLAEISFLSNPKDERLLKQPDYRQKIAQALYQGILRYVNNLGGVRVAEQPHSAKSGSETDAPLASSARELTASGHPNF